MRVAAELAQALRGEREPMQLLFPGGSIETAERIYRDSPTARFYNGLMAEMIAAAARQAREAGRPLRIPPESVQAPAATPGARADRAQPSERRRDTRSRTWGRCS